MPLISTPADTPSDMISPRKRTGRERAAGVYAFDVGIETRTGRGEGGGRGIGVDVDPRAGSGGSRGRKRRVCFRIFPCRIRARPPRISRRICIRGISILVDPFYCPAPPPTYRYRRRFSVPDIFWFPRTTRPAAAVFARTLIPAGVRKQVGAVTDRYTRPGPHRTRNKGEQSVRSDDISDGFEDGQISNRGKLHVVIGEAKNSDLLDAKFENLKSDVYHESGLQILKTVVFLNKNVGFQNR